MKLINFILRSSDFKHRTSYFALHILCFMLLAFSSCTNQNELYDSIFFLPVSKTIGISANGENKNKVSYYKANTQNILFDISNNRIQASFNEKGGLISTCIIKDIMYLTDSNHLPGVQNTRSFYQVDSLSLFFIAGKDSIMLDTCKFVQVDMVNHLFPKFIYRLKNFHIEMIAFAPLNESYSTSPQTIILLIKIENLSSNDLTCAINFLYNKRNDTIFYAFSQPEKPVFVESGKITYNSLAVSIGKDEQDLNQQIRFISKADHAEMFNQTLSLLESSTGELSIPDEPFYAELFVRAKELCRQCGLYQDSVTWGGGWLGSDHSIWQKNKVWTKDNYYQILPLCITEPLICKDAIPFFLNRSVPPFAYGGRKNRFPNTSRITHSLGNAMIPFMLAGVYYKSTADQDYFTNYPALLDSAFSMFDHIKTTALVDSISLYPSTQVSDGIAGGDFHTGSNVCLWYAITTMSVLAEDVYQKPALAQEWKQWADKIKQDIEKYCVTDGLFGKQFVEVVNLDGSIFPGHDGEESDVSLMPFYDFTSADDERLVHFSKLVLHESNPLYSKKLDGIWWYDQQWFPITSPGWVSALSGADTEQALSDYLHKLRLRTDVDGSFWWWTNKYGETDPANVTRLEGGAPKCGWAAGAYICHFVHDIIGLDVNNIKREVDFKPFVPWNSFNWKGYRSGNSTFDIAYNKSDQEITASITNLNETGYDLHAELMIPSGKKISGVMVNGKQKHEFITAERFGITSVILKEQLINYNPVKIKIRLI